MFNEINEREMTDFLNANAIYCKCVKVTESANFKRIDYDLASANCLKKLQKILPSLNMLMKTRCEIVDSLVAHIGLLLPRADRKEIPFEQYGLSNEEHQVTFGVTSDNTPVKRTFGKDLAHLLIAGASGSGKSVMLNSIIMQLIINTDIDNRDMYLIDLKKVELDIYNNYQCFSYGRIATESVRAMAILKGVSGVMEDRYTEMQSKKIRQWQGEKMYVVVDELAELVAQAPESEYYLSKIARMGRACGIHLILATQRPEVKICNGQILANIPTRIALQTSTSRESVMILGHKGAESLLGKGDAIVKLGDTNEEIRIQGLSIDEQYILDN